jgi:hypothetical protein
MYRNLNYVKTRVHIFKKLMNYVSKDKCPYSASCFQPSSFSPEFSEKEYLALAICTLPEERPDLKRYFAIRLALILIPVDF